MTTEVIFTDGNSVRFDGQPPLVGEHHLSVGSIGIPLVNVRFWNVLDPQERERAGELANI